MMANTEQEYRLGRDLGEQGVLNLCELIHTEGGLRVEDCFQIGEYRTNASDHPFPTTEIVFEVQPNWCARTIVTTNDISQQVLEYLYMATEDASKGYAIPSEHHSRGSMPYHKLLDRFEVLNLESIREAQA